VLKHLKNWLIYYTVAPLIWLLGRLPLFMVLPLGPALGRLAWLAAGRERRRAQRNLELALPEIAPASRRRMARQVFENLGRGAVECLAMDRLRPLLGGPRSPVEFAPGSLEVLREALQEGRGVIFATAHLGNWELLGAEVARHARLSVLFKPSYDPRFTRLMSAFRSRCGIRGVDVTHAAHVTSVLRALRAGEVVGILVDQPSPGERVPFFGREAPTSTLAPTLAARTGAAVLVGFIRRQGRRRHFITISRQGSRPEDATLATGEITAQVERAIRDAPTQWVWSLDRWRDSEDRRPGTHQCQCQKSANCIPASSD